MRRRLAWACVAFAACGGRGATTPEEALGALLDAARNNDGAAFRAGFPDEATLAASFACPPDLDLAARYAGLSDELVAWRSARVVSVTQAPIERVAAGGSVAERCTARVPMDLVRAEVVLDLGQRQARYAVRFVGLDGRWSVLAF